MHPPRTGNDVPMRRVQRTIRRSGNGINVVADLNAVIGEGSSSTTTTVTQRSSRPGAAPRGRTRGDQMAENEVRDELSDEELEQESGEELPDREAMSLINANVAAPINAAVAANILSDDSIAYANAEQDVDIDQSN